MHTAQVSMAAIENALQIIQVYIHPQLGMSHLGASPASWAAKRLTISSVIGSTDSTNWAAAKSTIRHTLGYTV